MAELKIPWFNMYNKYFLHYWLLPEKSASEWIAFSFGFVFYEHARQRNGYFLGHKIMSQNMLNIKQTNKKSWHNIISFLETFYIIMRGKNTYYI